MKVIHKDDNGVITRADVGEDNGHYYVIEASVHWAYAFRFQKGPVGEVGVNGITSEALLAILIHRTKVLNDKFPCPANDIAIDRMARALTAFEARTADRIERGVEGKNTK